MPQRIGIDLVHIPRITALLADQSALERIFSRKELSNRDPAHLAGVLAAKEAVFKALDVTPSWHDVIISSSPSGRPIATITHDLPSATIIDVSISHEGDYAVAVVLIEKT